MTMLTAQDGIMGSA